MLADLWDRLPPFWEAIIEALGSVAPTVQGRTVGSHAVPSLVRINWTSTATILVSIKCPVERALIEGLSTAVVRVAKISACTPAVRADLGDMLVRNQTVARKAVSKLRGKGKYLAPHALRSLEAALDLPTATLLCANAPPMSNNTQQAADALAQENRGQLLVPGKRKQQSPSEDTIPAKKRKTKQKQHSPREDTVSVHMVTNHSAVVEFVCELVQTTAQPATSMVAPHSRGATDVILCPLHPWWRATLKKRRPEPFWTKDEVVQMEQRWHLERNWDPTERGTVPGPAAFMETTAEQKLVPCNFTEFVECCAGVGLCTSKWPLRDRAADVVALANLRKALLELGTALSLERMVSCLVVGHMLFSPERIDEFGRALVKEGSHLRVALVTPIGKARKDRRRRNFEKKGRTAHGRPRFSE